MNSMSFDQNGINKRIDNSDYAADIKSRQKGSDSGSKQPAIQMPSLTLPKGGGAIKGIGETFQPDTFTGTAAYSITIPITAARAFEPQLSIEYSSGDGNGIFGMGFSLAIPAITRRTSKGIPRYDGHDIFIWGDSELVLKDQLPQTTDNDWNEFIYLPRVQADFSLIQHFIKKDGSESYWKITANDNTISFFGTATASRIYDPENPARIFSWLIDQSTDAKGNRIAYTYKSENNNNVPPAPWEQNRSYNNKYIQKMQYGNYTDKQGREQFAYTLIFDYGEYELPLPDDSGTFKPLTVDPWQPVKKWNYRADSFSSYTSGFEIRTCRLCRNIMLFHFFEQELGDPCLVRSVHFDYLSANSYNDINSPGLSTLSKATMTGYHRTGNKALDPYELQSMPAIQFTFSTFLAPQQPQFKKLTINNSNIPGYIDSTGFEPIDLNGEGIAGLLYQHNASLYYCAPEEEGQYDFPAAPLLFPGDHNGNNRNCSLTDLNGDGALDLVVHDAQRNGYYLKNNAGDWQPFIPFKTYPTNIGDPNVEMASLSNNGKTDAVIIDRSNLTLYSSLGTHGFAPAITVKNQPDFPLVKESYAKEYVGFSDMAGDGLSHRVKIANGLVEYWPDMGYGVFGKKITAGNAPWFGDDFDIARLFLADIDGSGTTDLVYVHHDRVVLYINQSGNYFSDPITVDLPEPYSSNDRIHFSDIRGNGTQCLVYTKAGALMRHYYYDFTGETVIDGQPQTSMKPYLLIEADNNLGAVSRVHYCSATKFYLQDKRSGNPWIARLPFPVQVAEKIQLIDKINKACYTSRFKYHDGHYDPVERAFIGFGFVEAWDTETFEEISNQWLYNVPAASNYVPPVYTKNWFHTGACFNNPAVMANYKAHFFQGDTKAYDFPDVVFDEAIYSQDSDTLRQAYLALKGQEIRTEIYGEDKEANPDLYKNPYTVTQSNEKVFLHQAKGDQPFAVFLVVPRESITYKYERNPEDPRIQQGFTLTTDAFGNPVSSCTVSLSRRSNAFPDFLEYPEQYSIKGRLTYTKYITPPDGFLFCDVPCEEQEFELNGIETDTKGYFSFDGIKKQIDTIGLPDRSTIISYDELFTTGIQARQITWSRDYYWNWANPNNDPVLGIISSPGLLHHSEEAVFPKTFTIDAFDGRLIDEEAYENDGYLSNIICTHGGYFYDPGKENNYWWDKGLVQYYYTPSKEVNTPQTFYLPSKTENSFARQPLVNAKGDPVTGLTQDPSLISCSRVYYDNYYLFVTSLTEDIDSNTSNTVSVAIDYSIAEAKQFTDVNGNITQVLFDALGQVIVSSIFGLEQGEPTGGMILYADGSKQAEYKDPGKGSFADVINNPEKYLQGAGTYYYYNLHAFTEAQQPICAVHLVRNHYWQAPDNNNQPYCQVIINYIDGLGKDIEQKLKCSLEDGTGKNIPDVKWQVTGRTVYNNKGVPCEQYLPYFSAVPEYEDQQAIKGPPPTITHYDPLLRVIRVDTPKRFFTRVDFSPWEEWHYDEDDTILDSYFYQHEYPGNLTPDEIDAIKKAVPFYNTPAITVLDNTGCPFLQIQNNLGNVTKDAFASLQTTVISSADIWNNLLTNGYLAPWPEHSEQNMHFCTSKFQPYTKGFVLQLDLKYNSLLPAITDILKENCLTSFCTTDISGRIIESVDPRLYYANIIHDTHNYNFRYRYTMNDNEPVFIDSADAGTDNPLLDSSAEKLLTNIFGSTLWLWSARSYCQFTLYDRLQRQLSLHVKQITTPGPVSNYNDFNVVELYLYGEAVNGPAGYNLRGQPYQVKDGSGIVTNPSYTMLGQPLQTTRQMAIDYKTPVSWSGLLPLLEDKVHSVQFTYNALQQMLTQTTPDGSVTTNSYNQVGLLRTIAVTYPDGKTVQRIIDNIEYDAKDQKALVRYGNGITTRYTYEETTLRLIAIKSTRAANGNNDPVVQDINYFYDPVGNITRTRDNTAGIIFNNNQRINPLSDYTYNAIYKLIIASGRQHTGINADTYQNNSKDSFKQCYFGPPPWLSDSDKLENYVETYTYDDAGNLTFIKHRASVTTSWSRDLPVQDTSNRLKNQLYDAAGNLLKLDISNDVDLTWDFSENLVRAGVITRENQPDDCDYYMYDSNDARTRKVSEKMAHGGQLTQVEDKIYLGNFSIKRNTLVTFDGTRIVIAEQNTLRVMDDQGCVAIIHFTTIDKTHPEKENQVQCRFQLNNNIGSVCLEMDAAAQLITYEEYFPYGGTAIITGISQAEVKAKEYRFSGKECDDNTGLYYYGARYYVSWQGRWLNPDPAGTVDGMNLFAFVGGSPIVFSDPNGNAGKTNTSGPLTRSKAKQQVGSQKAATVKMKTSKAPAKPKKKKAKGKGKKKKHFNGDMLAMRTKPNEDGTPTQGFTPTNNNYKTDLKIHWKGFRSDQGKTTGIVPYITTRDSKAWTPEHIASTQNLSKELMEIDGFTPLGNGNNEWAAEDSHIIAGSMWGPNDVLSAPPASVHQNTEWLAIEVGIKQLAQKGGFGDNLRIKATGYVYESGDKQGWLKSARYKIYINGTKVFDHVALGDRGNIDKAEATKLRDHVFGLTAASPATGSLIKNAKGISTIDPPTLAETRSHRTESIKSPLFTDVVFKNKTLTGQKAFDRVTKLYQ